MDTENKNLFDRLDPKHQTQFKKWGVISVVLAGALVFYYMSGMDDKKSTTPVKKEEIPFTDLLLEQDVRDSLDKDVQAATIEAQQATAAQEAMRAQMEELAKVIAALREQPPVTDPAAELDALADATRQKSNVYGTPYGSNSGSTYPPSAQYFEYSSNTQNPGLAIAPEPVAIGGIGFTPGLAPTMEGPTEPKKRTIRLPPSFMKASLLVGIDAMTSGMGEANPEPIILRVQAPAVLPNRLKQNLEGCFIVADAFGNLAKERVQVRLVSLHCNSLDGKAVIDQKIKGFVADSDGKRDLAGIVISKAGANMARAFLAQTVGGIGGALGSLGTTTTTTAIASTTNVDANKLLAGGIAQGIGAGSSEIAKVYLDLIKQSTPTIEVGAAKDLTVIIQEPVDLEIKSYE